MKTYFQLKKEFDEKVKELQRRCPHKKTGKIDFFASIDPKKRITRVTKPDYPTRACKLCNKLIEEKK